jgi:hypothetical protein
MLKSTIVAAVFSMALVAPALAETWKCDEGNLTQMKDYVGKLDSKAAQEAGLEWQLAMDAMKANNTEECNLRISNVNNKFLGGKDMERALDTEATPTTTQ